jgi:FkbM family methyltransferase
MADWRVETNGELRLANLLVPSCQVVFDVGARQDDYLVRINPRCDFHLFEPLDAHYQALTAKVRGRPNVTLNRCALGDSHGAAWIYPDCESIIDRHHGAAERVPILVTRLDDYCRERSIRRIDFLKIDTEGYELEVLRGGRDMVQSAIRIVQFEYGGTYADAGISLQMVFDLLGRDWFFYRIKSDHLLPIKAYHPRYEDGRYANYLASRERLSPAVVGPGALWRLLLRGWRRKKAA